MQTMRELIDQGFFPTDDDGNPLVPIVGSDVFGPGNATILVTDAPGDYPIVGLGPFGYATMWDENGVMRADRAMGVAGPVYHPWSSQLTGSLKVPRVEEFDIFTVIDAEGYVVDSYDNRQDALDDVPEGGQIVDTVGKRYVREPEEFVTSDFAALDIQCAKPVFEVLPARNEAPFGGFYRGLDFGVHPFIR